MPQLGASGQPGLHSAHPPTHPARQVFVNFAKKQSDNLEQQETEPPSALRSPLGRLLSLFRARPAPTELRALVADEPEDLDTEDEGLISFEEERVSPACRVRAARLASGLRLCIRRGLGEEWPRGLLPP